MIFHQSRRIGFAKNCGTLTLAFAPDSPERTHSEPRKCYGKQNDNGQASTSDLSCMILAIFLKGSGSEPHGHYQEEKSCDFKPKLVQGMSEGSRCGADSIHQGPGGTAASRLVASHTRRHPQLP